MTRLGYELITVNGRVSGQVELPPDQMNTEFYFKFLRAPDGGGITDPHLVYGEYHRHYELLENIDGTLELGESPLDPVADIVDPPDQVDHVVPSAHRPGGADRGAGAAGVAAAVRAPALRRRGPVRRAPAPSRRGCSAWTRYLIISADCHAGAECASTRVPRGAVPRTSSTRWAKTYVNPFADLRGVDADRNWDIGAALQELEADGVVAEVIFPNTIPPFFPSGEPRRAAPRRTTGVRAAVGRPAGAQPLAGRLLLPTLPGGAPAWRRSC